MKELLDGWKEETENHHEYKFYTSEEFDDINSGEVLRSKYLNTASKIVNDLQRVDLEVNGPNIFGYLLSDTVVLKISEHTTEILVKIGNPPTSIHEYKKILGTRWLRSRLRLGTSLAFNIMRETDKRGGFTLMTE